MKICVLCRKKKIRGNGTFFRIPTDDRRRQQWSNICKKELKQTAIMCADHFLPKDFIVGATLLKLMPSAVPSVGIGNETTINSPAKNEVVVDAYPKVPNRCENFGPQVAPKFVYEVIEYEANETVAELEEKRMDCCTQTDINVIISSSERENYKLRLDVKKLQSENLKLKEELQVANSAIANMKSIFTENQIRKMGNPEKRINWRREDISSGMGLLACGPRAYNHLYMKGFPLPNVSSLKRWARKSEVNPSNLNDSLDFMQDADDISKEVKVYVITKPPKNFSKK